MVICILVSSDLLPRCLKYRGVGFAFDQTVVVNFKVLPHYVFGTGLCILVIIIKCMGGGVQETESERLT
jgi:hypothetical protein